MSNDLKKVAQAMVAKGKGILAADESHPTIAKRFNTINVPNGEENRRNYRGMMFTAPNVGDYISGVIMYEETLGQQTDDGVAFPDLLEKQGILPGIKVDRGAKDLPGYPGEKYTLGLDDLRERLLIYREQGARFAKWRSVITIGNGMPSRYCIDVNARGLAHYAALCQEAGIVPIVEPEVLMDGDNTMAHCKAVTEITLDTVFEELRRARVDLEGIVLKPNMCISGIKCPEQASVEEVAAATVDTLKRCVPASVPGIAFLSGGQSDQLATAHLNAMNKMGELPWELSFSYGRALQSAGLKTWGGNNNNLEAAQAAFILRAKCNSAARFGEYTSDMEAV